MIKRLTKKQKNAIIRSIEHFSSFDFVEKVYLFGSCARGDNTPFSDVDILVLCSYEMEESKYRTFMMENCCINLQKNMYIEMDIKILKERYKDETQLYNRDVDSITKFFYKMLDKDKVLIYDRCNGFKYEFT